ncbi:Crp/Fnr family transcriptional regulator [Rufibacter immobilis]|uniref:Crp/Fnr family transcriptional regulator n=1 Tax=Rufibacter immobilis TaxID=1348778 RepID=UPI0035E4757B
MTDLYEYLQSIHSLSQEDHLLLTENFKSIRFKKGEHIITPGQIEKKLFFTKTGVQMYHFDTNQKTNILGFSYPPNLCAIPESFFFQRPSKYYLTCLTDSELDYITFEALQSLFDQSPQIERLFRKILELLTVGLINRQIEIRSTTIEERFKAFCQRSPHLLQLVPHKHIASYLAIDPTNFSKLYNTVKF